MAQPGDADSLPLRGVVLCCTALAQNARTTVSQLAGQMGAVHKLDLTSDTTHLIVGSIDTPKYRYVAKERPDIRVLSSEFVEAVRDAWIQGDAVDLAHLEEQHTLPPFLGLQVCLTGFDDLTQRKGLEKTLTANGATYHGDLTRTVTHLIAAKPEGAKYRHALQWNIHVVSLKWYEDCLIRGMAVDESLYGLQLPPDQQGIGAFRTIRKAKESKRGREGEEDMAGEEPSRRKLRKVASTRLDSQSQDMWRNISQAEVQLGNREVDAWDDANQRPLDAPLPVPVHKADQGRLITSETAQGLFSGHHIFIHGFEVVRATKLRTVLQQNGAAPVQTVEELEQASYSPDFRVRCLLVPHDWSKSIPEVPPGTLVVTEWWAERCLHYKEQLSPDSDCLSSPMFHAQVDGFQGLTISTTGFSGVDLRQTAQAVKLMGAEYQEQLLSSTSVLVCASAAVKKEKAFYASKYDIPTVSPKWLWDCLRSGKVVALDDYRIKVPSINPNELVSFNGGSAPGSACPSQVRNTKNLSDRSSEYAQPKRLSTTRKRHATPSLVLEALKPAPSDESRARKCPFILEDDDEDGGTHISNENAGRACAVSQHASQDRTLCEISPNASQPRVPPEPGEEETIKKPEPTCDSIEAPGTITRDSLRLGIPEPNMARAVNESENLMNDLNSILQRRKSANSIKAAMEPRKRKHRPLGRNLSGISHHSGSGSASPALPAEPPESVSLVDGFYVSRDEPVQQPPSTQLGYEDAETHAHRMQMSKTMGTTLVEEGIRLTTGATIKDSADVVARSARSVAGTSRAKTRTRGKT